MFRSFSPEAGPASQPGLQLVLTLSWGLIAFGAVAVVAAGVATGIRLARE